MIPNHKNDDFIQTKTLFLTDFNENRVFKLSVKKGSRQSKEAWDKY